jgi:hypothetical protein
VQVLFACCPKAATAVKESAINDNIIFPSKRRDVIAERKPEVAALPVNVLIV